MPYIELDPHISSLNMPLIQMSKDSTADVYHSTSVIVFVLGLLLLYKISVEHTKYMCLFLLCVSVFVVHLLLL